MAFQLKADESVSAGIKCNVKKQIEKALINLGTLSTKKKPHPPGANRKPLQRAADANDAVHDIRKCFKKVRAALRLVREDLGDEFYREENYRLRDAARPLTLVRDADVLIETADQLPRQFPEAVEAGVFPKIHEALLANRQQVIRRVLSDGKAVAVVEESATGALARLPGWPIARDGWAALEGGLRRVYRTGHHALALAAESPTVENLHELRKQAKYLWHHLQLLEAVWTGSGKELIDQTHHLSTILGEDHDLAVLRQTLAADPLAYGGHPVLKCVFAVIDRRRKELEQQGFALAWEVYKDPPKMFATRIGAEMKYEEVIQ